MADEKVLSRDEMLQNALAEGEANVNIDAVAEKDEELSVEDIRKAVGESAEGVSDEDLLKAWNEAQGEGTEKQTVEPLKLEGFKLYDKDQEIDVSKLKPEEAAMLKKVLEWQIGYQAMNKEQRKTLKDLARVASLGHYNESKMQQVVTERAEAAKRAREFEAKVTKYEQERGTWDQALTALINGNAKPMQDLALAYQAALGNAPASSTLVSTSPEDEATGQQFVLTTVVPRSQELAQQYGANAQEITNMALYLMNQEGEFLTEDKINAILQYELPHIIENAGYAANGTKTSAPVDDPRATEIAELKAAVQALQAGQGNKLTQAIRDKSKKAPPAGGGVAGGPTDGQKRFKSKAEMYEYLQSSGE